MSGPTGPESDEAECSQSAILMGPVIDVSVCDIGLLAIRYSTERPPRFVFMLEAMGSNWTQDWVN